KLIEFIILNSSITDAEIQKWNAQNAKKGKDMELVSTLSPPHHPSHSISPHPFTLRDPVESSPLTLYSLDPAELRAMCDHILTLMTETMPQMVDVLWPFLLEVLFSLSLLPPSVLPLSPRISCSTLT